MLSTPPYQKEEPTKCLENQRHHEQELLVKFSTLRKKCCDPLNRHPGKERTRSLRIVGMDVYRSLVNPPKMVVPGEKICCDCLITLQKIKLHPPAEESYSNDDASGSSLDIEHDFPGESTPTHSHSPEKTFDLNATLLSLDETPVKLHSLGPSSKRLKGQQKLASATGTLKRKLETVHDVPLGCSANEQNSSEKSDLQLFESMWVRLCRNCSKAWPNVSR